MAGADVHRAVCPDTGQRDRWEGRRLFGTI